MLMNIWEFLWLPSNHRPEDKTVMKVKHIDDVPASKVSWPMYGQIKKDGVFALIPKSEGHCATFSRTGKMFQNMNKMSLDFALSDSTDGIYIAELCNDSCSLEELSGMVNPNRNKPLTPEQEMVMGKSYFAFHDYIPVEEFVAGESSRIYSERGSQLCTHLSLDYSVLPIITLADEDQADTFYEMAIASGEEGIVIKPEETWEAGHKGYKMMKRVRGVDYDLLCIGVEEGKGKYKGLAANLFFRWKGGQTIKCMLGKGWTHEHAKQLWRAAHSDMFSDDMQYNPIGKIFQVYALQESSKGKLRLPKVGELRHDKTEADI